METEEVLLEDDLEERQGLDEIQYRDFQVESSDKESRTVEMNVPSEAPVERMWGGVVGLEVLVHSPDSINLERFKDGAAPLLMDHDQTNQKPSNHRIQKMELQETIEQAEVIDPEVKARLEKEAMKADRKRAKEIWEIAGFTGYL